MFPTEDVDEAYILDGLMVNMKITTPSSSDDSTRQSQFVLLLSVKVDVIRSPCLGNRIAVLKGCGRGRSLNRKSRRSPAWGAGTARGATISFSSMSLRGRRAACRASASHGPRRAAMKSWK